MAEPGRPQRKLSRVGESLYHVLGLQKGSSPEEIKKAYRYGGAGGGRWGGPGPRRGGDRPGVEAVRARGGPARGGGRSRSQAWEPAGGGARPGAEVRGRPAWG